MKDIYYKLRCVLLPLPFLGLQRSVIRDSPDFWGPLFVVLAYALISVYGQFRVRWMVCVCVCGKMDRCTYVFRCGRGDVTVVLIPGGGQVDIVDCLTAIGTLMGRGDGCHPQGDSTWMCLLLDTESPGADTGFVRRGEEGGLSTIERCRRQCIEVRTADQSAQRENFFRPHYSVVRMGSRGTFVLCTDVATSSNTNSECLGLASFRRCTRILAFTKKMP